MWLSGRTWQLSLPTFAGVGPVHSTTWYLSPPLPQMPLPCRPTPLLARPSHPLADHFSDWAATEQRPGINYINPEDYSPGTLRQQLSAASAAGADLIIVFIHWWAFGRGIWSAAHS